MNAFIWVSNSHPKLDCCRTNSSRLGLITKSIDDFGRRSDERDTGLFDFSCEARVFTEETVSRVDHVHSVLECDADDIILSEICSDRGQSSANLVRLIGTLTVGRHAIFVRVDGDGVHRELMRSSEYTDRDFLYISESTGVL